MTKWEYLSAEIMEEFFPESANKLGEKGWEMVACHLGGKPELTYLCIFKRPISYAKLTELYNSGRIADR